MKTISVTEIQISNERQRREFNPKTLQELVEDIRENGLFNAIVLRRPRLLAGPPGAQELLDTSDELILCQGERRLRAIQDLWELDGDLRYDGQIVPKGQVPYVTLGDLDPLQAELCELSENIRRDDLTWQEKAAATARIMKLRTALAAKEGDAPPPVSEISEEVRGSAEGFHQEATRREIIVSRYLHDPDVKAAKNLDEGYKVLKRKETARRNVELAETVGRTFSADSHTILHGDGMAWLKGCPSERFDVILTDPVYGMGADEFGDSDGRAAGAHKYEDSEELFHRMIHALDIDGTRVAKAEAHLYCFCDIDGFHYIRSALTYAGWWVHRTPLVWYKTNGSRVPWPQHGPQRKYELILYAVKGKRPSTGIYPDVLVYPSDANLGHSAQKPVALYADLLKRSIRPGDAVLDPFAGSGPLLPAAHGLKCLATLVEEDASSYGIILNRAKLLKAEESLESLP